MPDYLFMSVKVMRSTRMPKPPPLPLLFSHFEKIFSNGRTLTCKKTTQKSTFFMRYCNSNHKMAVF